MKETERVTAHSLFIFTAPNKPAAQQSICTPGAPGKSMAEFELALRPHSPSQGRPLITSKWQHQTCAKALFAHACKVPALVDCLGDRHERGRNTIARFSLSCPWLILERQ